jgi:hypothetical protein
MALGKADKEFWTQIINEELSARIQQLEAQSGRELIEGAMNIARERVAEEVGISDLLEEYESTDALANEHYQKYTALRDKTREISNEISDLLDEAGVQKYDTEARYHSTLGNDSRINIRAKSIFPDILRELGDKNADEIAELFEARKNIQRTIMLATSPTQLKRFLRQFAEKYGVNIGEEFEEV